MRVRVTHFTHTRPGTLRGGNYHSTNPEWRVENPSCFNGLKMNLGTRLRASEARSLKEESLKVSLDNGIMWIIRGRLS